MTEKQQQDVKVCQDNLHESTESFLYYASNLRVIEQLPQEVQAFANMAIIEYGVGREISRPIVEIDGVKVDIRILCRHVFASLDSEKRRFRNKEVIKKYQDRLQQAYAENTQGLSLVKMEETNKQLRKLIFEVNKHDVMDIEARILDFFPIAYIKDHIPLPNSLTHIGEYYKEALKKDWISRNEFDAIRIITQKIADYRHKSFEKHHKR